VRRAAICGIFAALGVCAAAAGQSGETAPAPATPEETPQYQTPAGSRFQFAWDALVRYDVIDLYRQAPVANIYRWRTEVRPEVDWIASDRFRLGVRLVGDLGSDSNSTNAARFDNYRSNGVALDRAYLEARPGSFLLEGGQFQMPMRSTEMLWDRDVQVIGGAAAWRLPTGAFSAVTLRGGYFYGPQRQHDDSHIFAAQAAWEIGDPARIAVDGAESYWRLTHLDDLAGHYLRQNTPGRGYVPLPGYTGSSYFTDFRLIDSLARVQFGGSWRFPVALSVDWVHNLGASTAYADAVEAALRIGKEGVPGDVQIFDVYQYVDRDALVGAYNTDDWWFHTWYTGHRVGLSVTVLPQIALRPSVVFQRRQDREHYLNRYLLDLVKTF
jgi:hypothetical protein